MEHYLSLALEIDLRREHGLAFFLGMCSFLAVSKRVETAIGLGRRDLRARRHHPDSTT